MSIKIEGLDEVIGNINKEIEGIRAGATKGLMAAGLKVEAESKRRTPRAYGNLVNSAYTRKVGDESVEIGYSAAYALFVHENMEMKLKGQPRPKPPGGHYWDKGRPKFLESAVRDLSQEIVNTVKQYALRG